MGPLLLALTLAASVPASAVEATPRGLEALKAQLAQDFLKGASVRQAREAWSAQEQQTGAALETFITRARAIQERTDIPSDFGAYEKEIREVGAGLGLSEADQGAGVIVYLGRLRQAGAAGASALTPEQHAEIDRRLTGVSRIGLSPLATRLLSGSAKAFGEETPDPGAGADPTPNHAPGRGGRLISGDDIASANRVELDQQAALAARFRTDGAVPLDAAPGGNSASWFGSIFGPDQPGGTSALGRAGRSIMDTPVLGDALSFVGDVGKSLYTGVTGNPGLTASGVDLPGGLTGAWTTGNMVAESAPFLLLGPGMSGLGRLPRIHTNGGLNIPRAATVVTTSLIDPAGLVTARPSGAVVATTLVTARRRVIPGSWFTPDEVVIEYVDRDGRVVRSERAPNR